MAAMEDLCLSYFMGGKPGYAVQLQQRVLENRERSDGPDAPATLAGMHRLANYHAACGDRDEARDLRTTVYQKYKLLLGPDARETVNAMQNLAISLDEYGKTDEALRLRQEVMDKLSHSGRVESDGIRAMANLAISYDKKARNEEALKLRETVLATSRKILGPEHAETVRAMGPLADSYDQHGRAEEARQLRQDAARLRGKALETPRVKSLNEITEVAVAYENAGLPEAAAKLREEIARRAELEVPANPDFQYIHPLRARAESRARAGRWKAAVEDEELIVSFSPVDSALWMRLAALRLRDGDPVAYAAMRERAIDELTNWPHLLITERLAKLCWLMPDPGMNKEQVKSWNTLALQLDGPSLPWAQWNMGLAEYRCGSFAAAEEMLGKCLAVDLTAECRACALAVRAMVLHELKREAEARESLAKSAAILGDIFAQPDNSTQKTGGAEWTDWLIARCLYREAEKVLGGN
jgi:tetratricopeptide (TPR) repeat protein